MSERKQRPSYLLSVLDNRCPRCREGHLFKHKNPYALKRHRFMQMNEKCPVCGQPTDIEVGFYYGTSYVSYALTIVFSVATFIAWWLLIGFSIDDDRIFWWLGINAVSLIVLQPVFMRLSRSFWISWFVKYDPDWEHHSVQESDRIVKEQMGNW
jgi:uncharacterized protein (DUF983 family)